MGEFILLNKDSSEDTHYLELKVKSRTCTATDCDKGTIKAYGGRIWDCGKCDSTGRESYIELTKEDIRKLLDQTTLI